MSTLNGRDVSELQGVMLGFWFASLDFVAVRALNEHGRPDRCFAQNWANARGVTRRLAYAWPVAGADNAAIGRELAGLAGDAELGCWMDYEKPPGGPLAAPGELADALHALDAAGMPCGFYSNRSELPRSAYLDAKAWWYADPSHNPAPPDRPALIVQTGETLGIDTDVADAAALDLFVRPNFGGFLMALSDAEQTELLAKVRALTDGTPFTYPLPVAVTRLLRDLRGDYPASDTPGALATATKLEQLLGRPAAPVAEVNVAGLASALVTALGPNLANQIARAVIGLEAAKLSA